MGFPAMEARCGANIAGRVEDPTDYRLPDARMATDEPT